MAAPPRERPNPRIRRVSPRAARYGIALVLSALLVATATAWYMLSCPLPTDASPVTVFVEPGSSTAHVADILHQQGIIRNPLAFRALARLMRADGRLQSGEYRFGPGIFAWDAIAALTTGQVVYYPVTLREGLTVTQIAALIEEKGFGSAEEILELCKDPSLLPVPEPAGGLGRVRYALEGYLFPDTYYFRKGMTAREIVQMMTSRFSAVFTEELIRKAQEAGMTPHEVATLASIVESEAYAAEERPIIAAVYLNRLKIGMKLDADPTVVYGLGKEPGYALLWRDLDSDSPYNTYRQPGLPPGPIGSFGEASLKAVLDPADVGYLYFVAKDDGTHAFARTLAEHNRNVSTYRGN